MPPSHGARLSLSVSKTFAKKTKVLDRVTFDVEAGETFVILGPSGCGKSTLLRILAGLESADPGSSVQMDGHEVVDVPAERRNVGLVFQRYALFPHLDVHRNIEYGLKIRGVPRADRDARVEELLTLVDLPDFGRRRVSTLSGGQMQRVALARALAPHPRVLLLDEPMTALDAKLKERLRTELHELLGRVGITTVYVTHDQTEALSLADHVVVMDHGRVDHIGTPQQIYEAPRDSFTASFVGTMNVLTGAWLAPSLPGFEGRVLFRPEEILVVPSGQGAFDAQVTTVFFQGERSRLVLRVDDEEFVTDVATSQAPAAGAWVGIQWNFRRNP